MSIYDDIARFDFDDLPAAAQEFLKRETAPSRAMETWEYYSYAYKRGFEEMVNHTASLAHHEYLLLPLYQVGRHSMELSIKAAIVEYSEYTGIDAKAAGHGLVSLFDALCEQIAAAGFDTDHEWTATSRKLVQHIENFDPAGDRFRYPVSRKGKKFDYTAIEFQQLVRAHAVVVVYADASVDMLQSEKDQPG